MTPPRRPDTPAPDPGSRESLGLDKDDTPGTHDDDAAKIAEEGEPFDDNFA